MSAVPEPPRNPPIHAHDALTSPMPRAAPVHRLGARRGETIAYAPIQLGAGEPGRGLTAFASRVRAGFPSPADDYVEDVLDLNKHLIRAGHEDATFVLRVEGWSMIGAGIFDGDEVIVDRALQAKEGSIVVAVVNGELTIKRLRFREGKPVLCPENPHFTDRTFADGEELVVWGVVTRSLHKL